MPDVPEPMQLGLLHPSLSAEEHQCQRHNNLCLYCGESGHYVRSCPAMIHKCLTISSACITTLPTHWTHLSLPIVLQVPRRSIWVPTIIDSGACSCFMDLSCITKPDGLSRMFSESEESSSLISCPLGTFCYCRETYFLKFNRLPWMCPYLRKQPCRPGMAYCGTKTKY